MKGESCMFNIANVRVVDSEFAKNKLTQYKDIYNGWPIFVQGMLMFAPRDGRIRDPELFKAICMGFRIDLSENMKLEQ